MITFEIEDLKAFRIVDLSTVDENSVASTYGQPLLVAFFSLFLSVDQGKSRDR